MAAGIAFVALAVTASLLVLKRQKTVPEEPEWEGEGPPGDREMSFFEHLEELRIRLLRAIFYWLVASGVGWHFYDRIWKILLDPIVPAMKQFGGQVAVQSIFEPIMLKLQISLASGLILAFPLILYEILAFIWPALYPHEKAFALKLVPASLLLFASGVLLCYYLIPFAAITMLRMGMPGSSPIEVVVLNFARLYMWTLAKVMAVFGLTFQMPLVLMFLGKLGIVSAKSLLRFWRHAVVAIFALAAIVTPTVDPINMSLLAGPLVGLYFLSVFLVALTQRDQREIT
ncbi:MAG: twin-arginine translocase subunit TatC [Armatimonadota bacterium]|nr:twin-arginine translocase subunit TatC [Armatimonadota bacterium]